MFLTGRGTLASCLHQEETRDKRVPVVAAGSGPFAGKLAPEYPEWSGCQSQRRRVPTSFRKGDPFQGPKLGSCLTLRNELSEETHADKARDFIGKGHLGGEQEGKGTQENRSAEWLAVWGCMVMGLVSGQSLGSHSNSESFLVAAHLAQPRWMPERRILGGGRTGGVSF